MNIKPIKNEQDLQQAFQRLEVIFDAEAGTPEFDEMDIIATLIEVYENKHYPIAHADPIEAIKFRMEQMNLSKADVMPIFGTKGRFSEVMNKKRRLSMAMIVKLNRQLKIPLESLISPEVSEINRLESHA